MKRILALLLVLSLLCLPALGDETNDMLGKANAFLSAGDFDSAAICLDIAQRLSPGDPAVPHAFARLYLAEDELDRALEAMETALSLAPADGGLYIEKARLLYAANRLSDAEQALRYAEICSAQPDDELLLSQGRASAANSIDAYVNYLTIRNDALGTGSRADAIWLPAGGSGQAEPAEISEYLTGAAEGTLARPAIMQVTLSPDGYSALILASYKAAPVCCILDLETLVCRRVEFPEDAQPSLVSLANARTALGWTENGLILIPNENGGHLCRLSAE